MKPTIQTLEQHLLDGQRAHPTARGEFSWLHSTMTVATRIISAHVRRAGLVDVRGAARIARIRVSLTPRSGVIRAAHD